MSLPLYALQQALYSRLSGDGVLMGMIEGIYDTVPQQSPFPYIVIGDGVQDDVVASGLVAVQCTLTIELFSRSKGRKEALLILERIYGLLHRNVLIVDGYECIVTRCERAETDMLLDALTLRGSMTVGVLLAEEVA